MSLPPEKVAILKDLQEFFHGDRGLITEYLARYGWVPVNASYVRVIRREHDEALAAVDHVIAQNRPESDPAEESDEPEDAGPAETSADGLKNPYYSMNVVCTACKNPFPGTILRFKSLIMEFAYKDPRFPLMVPHASSAMKHFRMDDPLVKAVMVCPVCFYAGSQSGLFMNDAGAPGKTGFLSKLHPRKIDLFRKILNDDREARAAIAGAWRPNRVNVGGLIRSPEEAVISYKLAARCAEKAAEIEPRMFQMAAESYLSAAKLSCDLGKTSEESQLLLAARKMLQAVYERGSNSALPLYLLGVTLWHLGEATSARTWIGYILLDRAGKFAGSSRYKRYCENLNDLIKSGATA